MQTLVEETLQVVEIADGASAEFFTSVLRPRLQGYEGSLRGKAYDSKMVDQANVLFDVRPNSVLFQLVATLIVRRFDVLGGTSNAGYVATFPQVEEDISGELTLARGQYQLSVENEGVTQVGIRLENRSGGTQQISVRSVVMGHIQPLYEDAELDKLAPYHAR